MARKLADGAIQLDNGRVIYADTPVEAQDICELVPILCPQLGAVFPGFLRGGAAGGFVASGGGGAAAISGPRGLQGDPGPQGPAGPALPSEKVFSTSFPPQSVPSAFATNAISARPNGTMTVFSRVPVPWRR